MKSPLPVIDGVSASRHWLPQGSWPTVLLFLQERFPHISRTTWRKRLIDGRVVDEHGTPINVETRYQAGSCIFYFREPAAETHIPFEELVLYEDDHIMVVDKPHFLPIVPAGRFLRETLLVRLRSRCQCPELVPAHRLDRETAGVILFSKQSATRGLYTALFRERRVQKLYEAFAASATQSHMNRRSRIVRGEPFFRMEEIAGPPNAETHIEMLSSTEGVGLYRLQPITGKKHQLRVHMAALGIPIENDRLYPEYKRQPDDFSRPLKLLARSIAFIDPVSGREMSFCSPRLL